MGRSDKPKAATDDTKVERKRAAVGRPRATRAKPAEPAQNRSDEGHGRFLELTSEGIWRYDLDPPVATDLPVEEQAEAILERARLSECNAAFARLFGSESPEEIRGRPLRDMLAGSREEQVQFIVHSIRSGYRITDMESTSLDRQGRTVRTLNNAVGLVEHGKLVCGWGTSRDVTSRHEAEERPRRTAQELEMAQRVARVGSWTWDIKAGRVEWSDEMYRIFGVDRETFSGSLEAVIDQAIHPDDRARVRESNRLVIEQGRPTPLEYRVVRPDGSVHIVWAEAGELVLDERGAPARLTGIVKDITRSRQAETALRASEERLSLALEATRDGIYDVDLRAGVAYYSPGYATMLGYRPDELTPSQETWEGLLHPDDRIGALQTLNRCLRGDIESYEMELRLRAKNGEWRRILSRGRVVGRDAKGNPLRLVGTHRDITERRLAERAVRESEEKYRLLVENAGEAVFVAQDGRLKFANAATSRLLGRSPEEVASRPFLDFIHPDDRAWVLERHRRRLAGDTIETGYTFRVVNGAGETRWVEISAVRITWDDRPATLNFVSDVTDRKRAELELKESEERFRSLYENATVGLYRTTPDGRILLANPAAVRMAGYESFAELAKRNLEEEGFEPGHPRAEFRRRIEADGEVHGLESSWIRKDGSTIHVRESARAVRDEHGKTLYYDGTFEDISEKVRAAKRLRKALEGTIQAVAGIAEIRDPYTAGHQERVTALACAIAREMRLSEERIEGLRVAGILHDVGKVAVPSEILSKPGGLTAAEFALVKTHPEAGHRILKAIDFPWPVAEAVLEHHERLDGSGYPRGLKDGEILLEARILAVADTVEAMMSHRPYRAALGIASGLAALEAGKGTLYDGDVVEACRRILTEGGFAFGP